MAHLPVSPVRDDIQPPDLVRHADGDYPVVHQGLVQPDSRAQLLLFEDGLTEEQVVDLHLPLGLGVQFTVQ